MNNGNGDGNGNGKGKGDGDGQGDGWVRGNAVKPYPSYCESAFSGIDRGCGRGDGYGCGESWGKKNARLVAIAYDRGDGWSCPWIFDDILGSYKNELSLRYGTSDGSGHGDGNSFDTLGQPRE
jgi:hypothetical protein